MRNFQTKDKLSEQIKIMLWFVDSNDLIQSAPTVTLRLFIRSLREKNWTPNEETVDGSEKSSKVPYDDEFAHPLNDSSNLLSLRCGEDDDEKK